MNSNGRPFQQPRAAAIRAGTLLDMTETARMTECGMPASMTPKLWRAIANEDPFHGNDPRVMSLCWCLFLMLQAKGYTRGDSPAAMHLRKAITSNQRRSHGRIPTLSGDAAASAARPPSTVLGCFRHPSSPPPNHSKNARNKFFDAGKNQNPSKQLKE
jgi:hypothetical protein